MFKKITACLVAILVISAWMPVYASTENVTKEVRDLTGLQMFWHIVKPNEGGQVEYYSLQISLSGEKPEHFVLNYSIEYTESNGYPLGSRYFTADIPKGDFDFKNKAKEDTLDFIAELAGSTKVVAGGYDGAYEIVAETKSFELHAVIGSHASLMVEQHSKTSDTKVISKARGDDWPAVISGRVDGAAIQDINGTLSTIMRTTTVIDPVKPAPEPTPVIKTTDLVAKRVTPASGKSDVTESRMIFIIASSGGTKDFEYTDADGNPATGTGSYSWLFNIQYSNGQYYITITYDEHGSADVSRVFKTKVPASAIVIPANFKGAMTLDLNLVEMLSRLPGFCLPARLLRKLPWKQSLKLLRMFH